jgi:glycine/D-amino acid oxidase-like deaminating enzyme/nitrite reductase/ring-hydroxylating ferredoxin subunit
VKTESIWEKVSTPVSYPPLTQDIHADVLIIGAGITGMTAGFELAKAGVTAVIVEAHRAGDGTTGYSTGNLYVPVQPYYQHIRSKFDKETIRVVAHSRKEALDYIERTVKECGIDCHFSRRPDYMFTETRSKDFIEKEFETLKEAGIAVEYTQDIPFPTDAKRAIYFPDQARFNPKTYIDGLAKAFTQKGGKLFEKTEIKEAEERNGQCRARTKRHTITARAMIMATHTPKGIHTMQMLAAPYRSYVVAAKLEGNQYPNGHFWNADPNGYISSTHAVYGQELDMLMVAGGHHKTGQAAHADAEHYYKNIESYIRERFKVDAILHRWSAQHYQAADDVPYIGLAHHRSKHFYVAGGYFADGLTYGTTAGCILADRIQDKANPWAKTYEATRFTPIASAGAAIRENVNVLSEYLKDLPGCRDATRFADIKPGEGGIVEMHGEKFAAYRDEDHALHVVSAVCTHLKCIVRFNNAEKTWDCPCHGSRFALDGGVLEGPAWEPLEKRKVEA